jgi:hypothetical protein
MPSQIRTRIAFTLALAAALLLATAACTTGGDDATETPSPTPDPALEARARSYLLTLEDFPEGWIIEPPEPESESDEPEYPGDIPPECEVLFEEEELPGTLIQIESDDFDRDGGGSVSSTATIMEDARVAADAFFLVRKLNRDCDSTIEDLLTFGIEQALLDEQDEDEPDADFTVLEISYDELPFPTYGDETLANRFTMLVQSEDTPVPVFIDSVAIRVGDAIATFDYTHSTNAPDVPEHQQELAAILEQKLRAPAP